MASMVGVPVMDNIPVPFSRTGSSRVNCANPLLSVLTLNACPALTAVKTKILPFNVAETTVESVLITVLNACAT